MEGYSEEGYLTEKLINAMLAGAVPIYWGGATVRHMFNSKALINVGDYDSFAAVAAHVAALDADPESAKQVVEQPPCTTLKYLMWWRY